MTEISAAPGLDRRVPSQVRHQQGHDLAEVEPPRARCAHVHHGRRHSDIAGIEQRMPAAGVNETVMMTDGVLSEGFGSNVFVEKDGVLFTVCIPLR
jgi:branched-subunit amino acid aminotransferase/4-amino-4-deoxychorismate lyase